MSLCAAFLLPKLAHAVLCDELTTLPHHVYGVGGSANEATLKKIQQAINADPTKTDDRITIFWADDKGACDRFEDFKAGKTAVQFNYWTSTDPKAANELCDAAPGGQAVSFSHMGNDVSLCPNPVLPAGIGDFAAPIQTLNIITDSKSNELSISAEALYFIYGFGPTGEAAPWTEGTGIFQRSASSFASLLLAGAINVPSAAFKWTANEKGKQGDVIKAVSGYATTEDLARQTLGYVSGSAADGARSGATPVKTLAYQHYDQTCGVYPDSDPSKLDKLNVREGKYFLWAAGHYFAKVDNKGKPLDPLVENIIGWFSKKTQAPGTKVSAFEQSILAGDIPQCAMHAAREGTIGAISSYADPKPCGCFFEHATNATVTSACTACTADTECSGDTPSCNFGYCEAYRSSGEVEG